MSGGCLKALDRERTLSDTACLRERCDLRDGEFGTDRTVSPVVGEGVRLYCSGLKSQERS